MHFLIAMLILGPDSPHSHLARSYQQETIFSTLQFENLKKVKVVIISVFSLQIIITGLPRLLNPVSLYSPSHIACFSLAGPLKLTVRQQGGEVVGMQHVILGSSSYFRVSLL